MRIWYAAATFVAALTVVMPAGASFPGENGRIFFQSNRAFPPEIYSMTKDGTDIRRLTWNAVADQVPRVSRDGSRIVFARTVAGIDQDIWIANADGTGERQLTSGPARDDLPVFTEDGDQVVFQRSVAPQTCPCELRVVGADGAGQRLLDTGPGNAANPDVSKNGKLVFAGDRDGTRSIYVTNLKGGPVKRVTEGPAAFGDFRPSWSPRGNDIVFMRNELGTLASLDIWRVHQDGTDLRRLTTTDRVEEYPRWSPDGRRIVFAVLEAVPPFGGRLHTMAAADGTDEHVLSQLAAPFVDGFDDGRIDSSHWYEVVEGTGVSVAEVGGRLVVDVGASAVPGGPFNLIGAHTGIQCQFVGDFDMQVGFALLDWPAANGLQAFLTGFTAFTSAQVIRESKPWGERYGSWIDPTFAATETTDLAGTLRLVRAAGVVTASYLSSSGWNVVNSAPRPEPMTAAIGAGDFQTFSGLHVGVAFDDFRINSGESTCPSRWRDSAPDWAAG